MEIMHPGGSYVFACLLSRKRICPSNLRSIRCICVGPARRPDVAGIPEIRGLIPSFPLYGQSLLCGLGVHILTSVYVARSPKEGWMVDSLSLHSPFSRKMSYICTDGR